MLARIPNTLDAFVAAAISLFRFFGGFMEIFFPDAVSGLALCRQCDSGAVPTPNTIAYGLTKCFFVA